MSAESRAGEVGGDLISRRVATMVEPADTPVLVAPLVLQFDRELGK